MAAQPIGWRHRLHDHLRLLRMHRERGSVVARYQRRQQMFRCLFERYAPEQSAHPQALEIGCGQRAPLVWLMSADGFRVTGIDLEQPTLNLSLRTFCATWRRNGPERALKSLVRHILFDRRFRRDFALAAGHRVGARDLDIRVMDACRLDFPDRSFDFLYSYGVFEHIPRDYVDAALAEIARVVKPLGLVAIYTSVWGGIDAGHLPEWGDPQDTSRQRSAPPWHHLRFPDRFPVNTHLNRMRIGEYEKSFAEHFGQCDFLCSRPAGEAYLTEAILNELPEFTRDELLTNALTLVGSRPVRAADNT